MSIWLCRRWSVPHSRPSRRGQRGYVLLTIAAISVVLLAFAGLVFDIGYEQFYKRRLQAAADAGAIGGIREIMMGNTSNVTTAATADVTANGFTNSVNGATVTINNPPTSGLFVGNSNYVEVIVTQTLSTTFMRVLNVNNMTVAARAVGGPGGSDACIYALDRGNDVVGFSVGGGVNVTSSCGVMVNSSDPTNATYISSNSCVTATAIGMVGGANVSSPCAPAPITGLAPVADPFAWLAAPTVPSTCDSNNYHTSTNATVGPATSGGTYVFCNGIKVTGGATLTLNPGLYIINDGGIDVEGGAALSGNGVTFYITGTSEHNYSGISFAGNSLETLTAPTSGTYASILFFQDRSLGAGTTNYFTGTQSSVYQGTIYFPTSNIIFSGTSATTAYTILVGDTVTVNGNSDIRNDYSTLPSGSPIKVASIVE